MAETAAEHAHPQRQPSRPEQGGRRNDANFQGSETKVDEIDRQQQTDEAIAKCAQCPRPEYPSQGWGRHRDTPAPKLKSSNAVTLSAFVHTPTAPAPAICESVSSM